jgi:hypothetical protein
MARALTLGFILMTLAAFGQETLDLITISSRYGAARPYDDFDGDARESGLLANAKQMCKIFRR